MLVPFYISSFGGTATMWLNKVLNSHAKVVSYHGTRSLPPYDSGTNDISPELFAKGLTLSMQNTGHSKIFGAIHGYYGLAMQAAMSHEGGVFCAVTRSPIKRINSLFNHHYDNFIKSNNQLRNKDTSVYADLVEKNFDQVSIDQQSNGIVTSGVVNTFQWICNETLKNDVALLDSIGIKLNFKMELLVKEQDYFVHFFETITDKKMPIEQAYLDEIFQISNINKHARVEESEQEIYQQWPDIFKLIYKNTVISNGGVNVLKKYQTIDYQVVDNLTDEFLLENNRFKLVN